MLLLFALASVLSAQDDDALRLWPGVAPGDTGDFPAEELTPLDDNGVNRVKNVSVPRLIHYPASADNRVGTCVVIAPGGGYSILAWQHEGKMVAEWLNSIGVDGVLLKYRVPRRKDRPKHEAPLQDAQRAIRMVRARAADWHIETNRVGLLGFSAGGHLTAVAATNSDRPAYEPIDDADKLSCRPDFMIPVYPAYLMNDDGNALAEEIRVDGNTPPLFTVVTHDDKDRGVGAARLYIACKEHKVPAELHVYLKGGHGYGMHDRGRPVNGWPAVCADWMKDMGLLEKKQ